MRHAKDRPRGRVKPPDLVARPIGRPDRAAAGRNADGARLAQRVVEPHSPGDRVRSRVDPGHGAVAIIADPDGTLADCYAPRSTGHADARQYGARCGIQPHESTSDRHPNGSEARRHVVRIRADPDRLVGVRDGPDHGHVSEARSACSSPRVDGAYPKRVSSESECRRVRVSTAVQTLPVDRATEPDLAGREADLVRDEPERRRAVGRAPRPEDTRRSRPRPPVPPSGDDRPGRGACARG
jgi:hypothetical protein